MQFYPKIKPHLRALYKHLLKAHRLGAVTAALACPSQCLTTLLVKNLQVLHKFEVVWELSHINNWPQNGALQNFTSDWPSA